MHASPLDDARESLRRAPCDRPCVLCVPAPDVPVERLLAVPLDGDAVLLAPTDADAIALAGRGSALSLTAPSLASLRPRAEDTLGTLSVVALSGADARPRLVGGQTFDPSRHDDDVWREFPCASLTLPRWALVRHEGRATLQVFFAPGSDRNVSCVSAVLDALTAAPRRDEPIPSVVNLVDDVPAARAAWRALVDDALAVMRAGRAEKLVAARRAAFALSSAPALDALLRGLELAAGGAPGCLRFALERGDTRFVGATPERLIARRRDTLYADALAGSIPRRESGDDRGSVQALLASAKDRHEHTLVVAMLRDALAHLGVTMHKPPPPTVRSLARVHHLWTPLRARVDGLAPHVLSLVEALHPTPALGGVPRAAALDWIAAREPHPRGWYAGPVGWCDRDGDGEFFVAIRSALTRGVSAWAWAGAGLVEGSDATREWDETEAKMAAMRAALGA